MTEQHTHPGGSGALETNETPPKDPAVRKYPPDLKRSGVPGRRVVVLRELLERYRELVELSETVRVAGGSGGVMLSPHEPRCWLVTSSGDQGLWGRRCSCAFRGVRELERLLVVMRDDRERRVGVEGVGLVSPRMLWWHVNERFVAGCSRTVDRLVVRRVRGGKRLVVKVRVVEPVFDRRVDERMVAAGVAFAIWAPETYRGRDRAAKP